MSRSVRAAIALACAALASAASATALASERDGLYGRFDGDLELHLGAGVAVAHGGPMLAARLDALYLSTAGIYTHYADAVGADGPSVERSIAAGFLIQPLFLGRFASDLERGPARLDLFVDSFALGLGAFWHMPRGGAFEETPGLEASVGLGFPFFEDGTGPVVGVRGALRWRAVDLDNSTASGDIFEKGALLTITLAWHHIVRVHLVDAGDRLPR